MHDLLIGIGMVAGMALFVYAFIREGRRQRSRRREPFRRLAERRGWQYLQEDDGRVAKAARGFEAFGVFRSPSLGEVKPQNVVTGTLEEGAVWIFWHRRHLSEGQAYPFYVVLIETGRPLADGLVVRKGAPGLGGQAFYAGREVRVEVEGVDLRMFARDPTEAEESMDRTRDRHLARLMGDLPWPVDLQVQGSRVALYTWKELDLEGVAELERLLDAAQEVTRTLLAAAT